MTGRMFGCVRNPVSERMPVSEVNDRSGIELLILSVLRPYATLERKAFRARAVEDTDVTYPRMGPSGLPGASPGKHS